MSFLPMISLIGFFKKFAKLELTITWRPSKSLAKIKSEVLSMTECKRL